MSHGNQFGCDFFFIQLTISVGNRNGNTDSGKKPYWSLNWMIKSNHYLIKLMTKKNSTNIMEFYTLIIFSFISIGHKLNRQLNLHYKLYNMWYFKNKSDTHIHYITCWYRDVFSHFISVMAIFFPIWFFAVDISNHSIFKSVDSPRYCITIQKFVVAINSLAMTCMVCVKCAWWIDDTIRYDWKKHFSSLFCFCLFLIQCPFHYLSLCVILPVWIK